MKKKFNAKILMALSVLLLSSLLTVTGLAVHRDDNIPKEGHVVFTDLSELSPNGCMVHETTDAYGNPVTVGIERAASPHSRAAGESWRVWYASGTINAEFYMTVSDNKVTGVSDAKISTIGGSYDNESLTKTSTYGKLSFKYAFVGNLYNKSCWLKGTVTGSDNEIDVTWNM